MDTLQRWFAREWLALCSGKKLLNETLNEMAWMRNAGLINK